MPGTHDERGGDEAAAEVVGLLRSLPRTKITPETVTQHLIDRWYSEKSNYLEQISNLCNQIRDLCEQLAAATARAEKAEAKVAQLRRRDAVQTQAIRAAKGLADCYRQAAEATDAAQDGLSATETAGNGAQESADVSTPVRAKELAAATTGWILWDAEGRWLHATTSPSNDGWRAVSINEDEVQEWQSKGAILDRMDEAGWRAYGEGDLARWQFEPGSRDKWLTARDAKAGEPR